MTKIAAMLHHEGLASKTVLMPVSPWGRFTTALNAALVKAVDGGYDVVAYQSLEFRVSPAAVTQLLAFMVPGDTRGGDAGGGRTLVVGPAMTGHAFAPGTQAVRGRTVPWNTFALWCVSFLRTFIPIRLLTPLKITHLATLPTGQVGAGPGAHGLPRRGRRGPR